MSAKAVLERWSREVIQHAPATGVDGYGQRIYGPQVSRRARIDYATKLIRNAQGQEVVSGAQTYLATTDPISVLDRITLPDGTSPLLLRVDRLADYQGQKWLCVLYFA